MSHIIVCVKYSFVCMVISEGIRRSIHTLSHHKVPLNHDCRTALTKNWARATHVLNKSDMKTH